MVPDWYHTGVDVNVKGLDESVVARLAEQAVAEGMSQQEWLRQVLGRTAARLSPAELVAQRAAVTPMSDREFATIRRRAAAARKRSMDKLGAARRGR